MQLSDRKYVHCCKEGLCKASRSSPGACLESHRGWLFLQKEGALSFSLSFPPPTPDPGPPTESLMSVEPQSWGEGDQCAGRRGSKFGTTWGNVWDAFHCLGPLASSCSGLGGSLVKQEWLLPYTVSRGIYMPWPPLISCHLENWEGAQPAARPHSKQAFSRSASNALVLVLLAAAVLRTAFPHRRRGKS